MKSESVNVCGYNSTSFSQLRQLMCGFFSPSTSTDKNNLSLLHQEIKAHLDPHPHNKIKQQDHPQFWSFFVIFAIFLNPPQYCRQTGEWGQNKLYCPGLEVGIFLFLQPLVLSLCPVPVLRSPVCPHKVTQVPPTGNSAPLGCHRQGFGSNSSSLLSPRAGSASPSPWIWPWDNIRVKNQHSLVCASLPFNFWYFSVKILKNHNVFYM